MVQEESILVLIKIISSLEYESESKASTDFSSLPIYTFILLISPPLSPLPIDFSLSYNNNNSNIISQHNINQLLEQIATLQAIIVGRGKTAAKGSNTGPNIEMAKLPVSRKKTSRVAEFITAYKLFLRIKIREAVVEKQIQ